MSREEPNNPRKVYHESLHDVAATFVKNNVSFRNLSKRDLNELRLKVNQEIAFLEDRIKHIHRLNNLDDNTVVLNTYEDMLKSRNAVLEWLNSEYGGEQLDQTGLA